MKAIVVVTGFGRCGSSLAMRMLCAGGMPVTTDNRDSFEDERVMRLPGDTRWLRECEGRALKVLDPYRAKGTYIPISHGAGRRPLKESPASGRFFPVFSYFFLLRRV